MKNLVIIIGISFALMACKTRHTAISKTDITTTADSTHVIKKAVEITDTGKKHTDIAIKKDVQDSVEVDITPDSGAVQTTHIGVDHSFTFTGKAKKIVFKGKVNDHSHIDESIQINKAQITKQTLSDSAAKKTQTHQVTKNKTIDAKADDSWVWMVLGVVAIVAVGFGLYLKFKPG